MTLEAITLKTEIKEAVKKSFIKIIESNKDIYSFALYSDENCETLGVVSNTIDFYQKRKKLNGEDESDLYSKFSPEEWDFSIFWGGEEDIEFDKISKILYENADRYDFEIPEDEVKFNKFQQAFYQVCIDVLKELKSESFFKSIFPRDIFILFSASEYEFETLAQKEMIRSLNDNIYGEEYIAWMESWN